MKPVTLISLEDLSEWREEQFLNNETVALVPTMGALHPGHLSLVVAAKDKASKIVVSTFVNPKQFGPNEDFAKYPRTINDDLEKLAALNVDAVFMPNAAQIYPTDFQTSLHNSSMSKGLCGASRPGHFDGVLTVVLKLFNLVRPDYAAFGKKDYQQLKVIEQMVSDLCLPVTIIKGETVRDEDGLALSSRNKFLSDTQRPVATRIITALKACEEVYKSGTRNKETLTEAFMKVISENSEVRLDYFEIRSQDRLQEIDEAELTQSAVILAAAFLGETRLIDNLELND
jgi:pantoate--beta-alanine ligase